MQQASRWFNMNDPYAYRDENLRALGYASYRAYLKSALWASIRTRVLAREPHPGRCDKCRKPATQIHHRAYDPKTLSGECLDALTKTCAYHHVRAERPNDHGQTKYDRFSRASFYLGRETARHPREWEVKAAKRRWKKGN